jgi:tRNA(Ile)-lysidine synthase
MLVAGDRVLVAVSGGPDSVALLGVLAALSPDYGIELQAAHFNHQLRGEESSRDQACVGAATARLAVPCTFGRGDVLPGAPNLEARARDQRYAFLTQAAAAPGCTKIATGHTLDDQAETVLMRLLRGTGWDGLAGIRAVRQGYIIRPLIECSRQQVLAFLESSGLPFCHDSSNQDRRFLRNRVRHEIMPLLEAINPAVRRRLASAADVAAAESRLLEEQVESIIERTRSGDGALAVSVVTGAPPGLRGRLVRAWLRTCRGHLRRLTGAHVHAILDLAQGSRPNAQVRLPAGERVVREYDRLCFRPDDHPLAVEPPRMLVPGSAVVLDSGWRISAGVEPIEGNWQRPADLWSLVADADAVRLPLVVRTTRPGDRVRPLGLGGHRKLQDIFVDRKLPLSARRTCPVVECEGEILWVPGVVRAQRAVITPATRLALRLIAQKPGIAGP